MEWRIEVPIPDERVLNKFQVGDVVWLSGRIFTARDLAHIRISSLLKEKKELPFDLKNSAVYHAGPVAVRDRKGWKINAIGPTTSKRMDPFTEMLGKLGVKLIVGKGGMRSKNAFSKFNMIYLNALPGCGVLGAESIKDVINVYWLDLGIPEAVWELETENWGPLIVGIDSSGRSIYDMVRKRAFERLNKMK